MRALSLLLMTACRVSFEDTTNAGTGTNIGDGGGSSSPDGGADAGGSSITAVQTTQTTSTDDTGPRVVNFSTATTTGNAIVVLAWSWAGGTASYAAGGVTDPQGNTYSLASTHTVITTCAGGSAGLAIYLAKNIIGGAAPALSLQPTGDDMQQLAVVAIEYAGLSVAPLVSTGQTTSTGSSPLTVVAGPVITTAPDTLIVSVATICGGYPDPILWVANPGFAQRGIEPATFNLAPGIAGDRIAAAGTVTEKWNATFSGSTEIDAYGISIALR